MTEGIDQRIPRDPMDEDEPASPGSSPVPPLARVGGPRPGTLLGPGVRAGANGGRLGSNGSHHDAGRKSDPGPKIDFQALLERIPAVTYVAGFGRSATWYYASSYLETLVGFTPEEWCADPDLWFRQIHPDDRGQVLEEELTSKMTDGGLASQYRLMTRDGRTVWVRDDAVLVRDPSGEPLYWQGFLVDVTSHRQTAAALHESEILYRSLFDHVPVGLYRTAPDGTLADGNRALAQILGYPNRETLLAADAFEIYVEPAERERWMALMESEGIVRDFEVQLRRVDGSVIWVRDSGRVIRTPDDRVIWYEGVLEDVTRRKQAEWEVRQANQQLSDTVARLERQKREMSLINEMGDMLQSCPNEQEAHQVMAHWAEQLFAGCAGALFVISSSRNAVEPVAVWGTFASGEGPFAPDECWSLRAGRPHLVEETGSRLICRHFVEPPRGATLCVPMMAQGEALGVLTLEFPPNTVRISAGAVEGVDSIKSLALAVGEHLALALANLKLRETLRTQSIRDPLTGLYNRRYMEESLERELRRADRKGTQVGVVMLDLDHFNLFNNTFGHQAGDALLMAFGEMVRNRVRSEDIACRYGGEEFTLILPEATLEVAVARAEQIREELRALRVQHRGQALGIVTVSVGASVYPEHGRTGDELIRTADLALYQAKDGGRDRTVAAEVATLRRA
jgi:diguanylate cyclase (GGDEF)-like protein/PAS domain S-box-containing protein